MAPPVNMHASAVLVGDRGVLVMGASGSGKTRLALALLREATVHGRLGRLVADDQVLLSAAHGRLVASAPQAIAGLCEIRGFGVAAIAYEPACVVDLLVRLAPAAQAPRMAAGRRETLAGCAVPVLELAERDASGAVLAVTALLFGADANGSTSGSMSLSEKPATPR
ncbi:MAG TPA: HPr kinase/phosphorylase [Mesorhizobium sp.]|jgi:serine kinase of HPr protein (carbohydrate metabolism regulator)|nr:HPr kinase/phosphorylase [Mesorhizobium sp.]